jgi:hypothetical protein
MAKILTLLDGTPLKVNGKDVYEAVYSGVVKQVDVAARKMSMVGTDETVDRDGDIIEMKGWQLENYRKNPVFLWAHEYFGVPLARTEKVIKRKDPVRMEFQLLYPTKGLHPFADMILELYGEYIINASSVGFIPGEWVDIEQEGERQPGVRHTWGRRFTKQELLELSGCAVPSNPNALQNALKGKNFLNTPFEEVQKWLQGKSQPPKPTHVDDIMGELELKRADYVDETKPLMVQVPKNLCIVEEEIECNWDGKLEGLEVPPFDKGFEISKEDVLKPYPNEHACRLEDPGQFERFARKNCYRKHDGKCIDFIFGYPKEGGGKVQAMRYDKEVWTATAARAHCKTHDGTFEAAKEVNIPAIFIDPLILETMNGIKEEIGNFIKEIKDGNKEILEAIKLLKSSGADLAELPIDQGPIEDGKGVGASETILGEAFSSGKGAPNITIPPTPSQYDFKGLVMELKALKESLKSLKGE